MTDLDALEALAKDARREIDASSGPPVSYYADEMADAMPGLIAEVRRLRQLVEDDNAIFAEGEQQSREATEDEK